MSSTPNPSFSPSAILPSTFTHLLSLYPATARTVYETKLRKKSKKATDEDIKTQVNEFVELDKWRYETFPAALEQRRADKEDSPTTVLTKRAKKDHDGSKVPPDNGLFLEEEELVRLMEWKLKHGTFRPALMNQIRTNPGFQIHLSTKRALSSLPAFSNSNNQNANVDVDVDADADANSLFPGTAIDILHGALRGVGPATASLILSASTATSPTIMTQIPFFSDEMYWWLCAQRYPVPSTGSRSGSAKDAKQTKPAPKLKYTIKEYRELWDAVGQFVERLHDADDDDEKEKEESKCSFSMLDVEKVAFVIGHFEQSGYEEGMTTDLKMSKAETKKEEENEESKIHPPAADTPADHKDTTTASTQAKSRKRKR